LLTIAVWNTSTLLFTKQAKQHTIHTIHTMLQLLLCLLALAPLGRAQFEIPYSPLDVVGITRKITLTLGRMSFTDPVYGNVRDVRMHTNTHRPTHTLLNPTLE
jgi:hypothetical protein